MDGRYTSTARGAVVCARSCTTIAGVLLTAARMVYNYTVYHPVSDRCNNAETREDILGDNRCRWNAESLKQFTGLEDADLIYLSFQSEVNFHCLQPYYY